jgi:hypothetical protein
MWRGATAPPKESLDVPFPCSSACWRLSKFVVVLVELKFVFLVGASQGASLYVVANPVVCSVDSDSLWEPLRLSAKSTP